MADATPPKEVAGAPPHQAGSASEAAAASAAAGNSPPPGIASLISSALLIAIACSFAWYGLLGRFANSIGPLWYAGWVLAILAPPLVYLTLRTGSVKRAVGPFLFITTLGLLLAIVFPVALL